MKTLNLYKDRQYNLIKIGKKEFKIPTEYTVEEAERLLELQEENEKIESQYVGDTVEDTKRKMQIFWDNIFGQLEIIFQKYQPAMTASELKKIVSGDSALEILGFFEKYRKIFKQKDVKKKLN